MSENTEQEATSVPAPESPAEAQTVPMPEVQAAAPAATTPQHHVSTNAKIAIAVAAGVLAGMLLLGAAFAIPAAFHGVAVRRAAVQGQMMGRGFAPQDDGYGYGPGGMMDDQSGRGGMMGRQGGRGFRGQGDANTNQSCPGCDDSGAGGYGPGQRGNMPCDTDGDGQPDVAPQGKTPPTQ